MCSCRPWPGSLPAPLRRMPTVPGTGTPPSMPCTGVCPHTCLLLAGPPCGGFVSVPCSPPADCLPLSSLMEAGLGITLACAPYMEPFVRHILASIRPCAACCIPSTGLPRASAKYRVPGKLLPQILFKSDWLTTARHIRTACVGLSTIQPRFPDHGASLGRAEPIAASIL